MWMLDMLFSDEGLSLDACEQMFHGLAFVEGLDSFEIWETLVCASSTDEALKFAKKIDWGEREQED
jgi:hypothetical protein